MINPITDVISGSFIEVEGEVLGGAVGRETGNVEELVELVGSG